MMRRILFWYLNREPAVLFRIRLAVRNAWFRWIRYRHFKTAACDVCGDYVLEAQLARVSPEHLACLECVDLVRAVRAAYRNREGRT